MGFTYSPSQDSALYWQQGHSSEHDFIYTTTQSFTHEALKALSLEVGPDRTLLICCKAFRARLSEFPNLTVKKIPQAVLDNCEWGRDDYSLNVSAANYEPADEPEEGRGPGNDHGGNGGATHNNRRRGSRRPASPPEVHTSPIRKQPLKMDGTTRAASAGRKSAKKVFAKDSPTKSTKASPSKNGAAKHPVARAKPSRTTKHKTRAKAAGAAKSKRSRVTDDRQGRLL
jgi:hypothetical protein